MSIDPGGIVDFINQYASTWSPFMADVRLRALEDFLSSLARRDDDAFSESKWLRKTDPLGQVARPKPYAGWELEQWMPGYKKLVKNLMNHLVDFDYEGIWPGASPVPNTKMKFGRPQSKDQLIEHCSTFLYGCINAFLAKSEAECFVEDNTWSILFAKDLLDLVPTGKILHIVRDPRDVIASLLKQRWTPSTLEQIIPWYQSVMQTWEHQKAQLYSDQYLEIRLEDIIDDPRKTIGTACTFCSLDFEEGMIDLDLSKSNQGRYKDAFDSNQITFIEDALSSVINRYGY